MTLHVGYGTFAPVRDEDITRHRIHEEYFSISQATVDAVEMTKKRGGKIWAVGTTTVRALECAGQASGRLQAMAGWCNLYIYPGFRFRVIDNLITNFHLPDSSLLFLVAALCGRRTLLDCYQTAIREGYRFFSYGDAMAIISRKGNKELRTAGIKLSDQAGAVAGQPAQLPPAGHACGRLGGGIALGGGNIALGDAAEALE